MIAVLDTHVVLWWFDRSARLSRAQQRLLARNSDGRPVGVADTSLWEIALLVEAGRVRLALPIDEWLARATAAPRVEVYPVTPGVASEVVALGSTRGWDPADRIIVATARVLGVPLVTSDARIIDSRLVRTIS
ncbi:MAG TPA: type II toxin-antitoxin system VapC family toxin [Kofleriaceae bacterium]|jgi:PIN domain nuclease of toxin-antitoxin system|nr:type II toxin-antitoxin system VapC family toxin [Kofleriaceae bacterium]